jgi:hypothetical protein
MSTFQNAPGSGEADSVSYRSNKSARHAGAAGRNTAQPLGVDYTGGSA